LLQHTTSYVALRRPYVINDLASQHVLLDRRQVYAVLERAGIPTARHVVLNRREDASERPADDADKDAAVAAAAQAAAAQAAAVAATAAAAAAA
jgi:hypothetical protein